MLRNLVLNGIVSLSVYFCNILRQIFDSTVVPRLLELMAISLCGYVSYTFLLNR
uniref:Uncharacterized protein n=1 Tax=Rhizophora mucronata TaxID=61149 RepID=A0A2P2PD18_RHIMU